MKTPKWTLKKVKTSDLKDYYKNPRSLSEDQANHLKTSVDKFGLIDKPIVNQDYTLIGGHQRKKVYSGEEIEVWFPDRKLSEKEVEELNIRLNANTGSWDHIILDQEWDKEDLKDWGLLDDHEEGVMDIETVEDFSEGYTISISCDDIQQYEDVQTKLMISGKKISYDKFIEAWK